MEQFLSASSRPSLAIRPSRPAFVGAWDVVRSSPQCAGWLYAPLLGPSLEHFWDAFWQASRAQRAFRTAAARELCSRSGLSEQAMACALERKTARDLEALLVAEPSRSALRWVLGGDRRFLELEPGARLVLLDSLCAPGLVPAVLFSIPEPWPGLARTWANLAEAAPRTPLGLTFPAGVARAVLGAASGRAAAVLRSGWQAEASPHMRA